MLFATAGQGQVFLLLCAAGALIGAWYDVCRAVARLLAAGFFLSLLTDAAFGLGAAGLLGAAAVAANYGALRLYMLLAAALGWALYAIGLSRPLRALARRGRARGGRWLRRLKENRITKVIFR